MVLGAGRAKKEDLIDYAVGLTLNKKIGDAIQIGESICTIHANRLDVAEVEAMILDAYKITSSQPAPKQLIYDVIE
ncbi:Pyrimidine-nucleoside phosphorylase [compost metagenome]